MANYKKILAVRPEMADFIRAQRYIRHRGDVYAYPPKMRCSSFSTDEGGFRHSTLNGRSFSISSCLKSKRYGVVLGASNNFGFGVVGNENTMASLLAERFGFPFANAALPGGTSRNLHSLLLAFLARAPAPPSIVVHSSGGDLNTFCASSLADSVFGSPNRGQREGLVKEESRLADPDVNFPLMLAFTTLWTAAIATLCRASRMPLVVLHQSTFFEKSNPNRTELQYELGKAFQEGQAREFDNHKKFNVRFYVRRKEIADRIGIPLAGWGLTDQLSFLDEFHCDREGIQVLSKAVGDVIEQQLAAATTAAG